jgi:hypothetical protein
MAQPKREDALNLWVQRTVLAALLGMAMVLFVLGARLVAEAATY